MMVASTCEYHDALPAAGSGLSWGSWQPPTPAGTWLALQWTKGGFLIPTTMLPPASETGSWVRFDFQGHALQPACPSHAALAM